MAGGMNDQIISRGNVTLDFVERKESLSKLLLFTWREGEVDVDLFQKILTRSCRNSDPNSLPTGSGLEYHNLSPVNTSRPIFVPNE